MSLSIGIVGLPNVGKSTLFQAITKKQVDCSNYPFCTIEPNVGIVAVPDERVDRLALLENSAKKIYSTIKFIDIAGLIKGASIGEGLGNRFLANIREVDAIVYVLRCFKNDKITNVLDKIDIIGEKEILDTEMALKDLETVEKRISGLEKESKTGDKTVLKELSILKKIEGLLEQGIIPSRIDWDEKEIMLLRGYQLLTMKPRLYLLNGKDSEVSSDTIELFRENDWPFLAMDILSELDSEDLTSEERVVLELPVELRLNELIKESYKLLGLITFFTMGSDEVRAWTLKKGSTASKAGGVVHSDFEQYFIKAEVINWKTLIDIGGYAKAREKGLVRIEGKEYIVQDGDVITIKSGK